MSVLAAGRFCVARASQFCVARVICGFTMVTMTVFDFDTGPNGDYVERFIAPGYAYYRTPLRAASGNEVASTLLVDRATHTFTSTALGDGGT